MSKSARDKIDGGAAGGGSADRPTGRSRSRRVSAAEFKAVCLSLMDRVKESGREYVITKRGRPVAKLAPISEEVRPFIGRSRGVITVTRADLLAPLAEDYDVGADL